MFSRFIHVVACDRISFQGWLIFHSLYIPHFAYPFIHGWTLGLLSPFGNCQQCWHEHGCTISLWDTAFNSFGYIPRSGIARSYGKSLFNFGGNLHTFFHSDYTILPFYCVPTVHEGSNFSTSSPFSVFSIVAILISVRWHLIVVLICISLMINDIEHLFMCLLVICISFLEKHLLKSFAHFWIGLFVLYR